MRTDSVICNPVTWPLRHRPAGNRRELESLRAGFENANQHLCDAQAAGARGAADVATFTRLRTTRATSPDLDRTQRAPHGERQGH